MTVRAGGKGFGVEPAHTSSPSAVALRLRRVGHATTLADTVLVDY